MSTTSPQHIGNSQTEKPTSWTIMLYITADGTLTNFAVESLKQLNEAVSTLTGPTTVKVAAHFSFPGGATDPAAAARRPPTRPYANTPFRRPARSHLSVPPRSALCL